ncbi:S8 family serine peptidase [Microbacterium sp. NPDC007973]|uniref:S53 family peptidase n=1 Tax=Microbacterium sp. NPDC007973 TaxID=3364182 RepID=UPI0036ECEAED
MRFTPRRRSTTLPLALLLVAVSVTAGCAASPPSNPAMDGARRTLIASSPAWAHDAPELGDDVSLTASVLLTDSATGLETAAVRDWLDAQGLRLEGQRDSVRLLSVSGSSTQFASAFDTAFGTTTVAGRTAVAPTRDLSVPAALTGLETVAGLVDTDALHPSVTAAPVRSDDCARYWGETLSASWPEAVKVEQRSNALCGYGPAQLRAVHELPADATGSGATVAIVGVFDDADVAADTDTYFTGADLAGWRDGQYVHNAPAAPQTSRCGGPAAWSVEQRLDVQAVHAVAPDADIVYWGADDCLAQTLYLRVLDAVEAPVRPDVVSLSFGGPEDLDTDGDRVLLNRVLVEAASRGVSVFASSGNDGDYSLVGDHHDHTDVATPASSAYITAVGGASIGLDADDHVAVEAGWEVQTRFAHNGGIIPPGFIYGAGGGESAYYPRPSWQSEHVPHSGTGRLVPDVASLADPNTGFTVAVRRSGALAYEAHGGTSLATPMVASMVAIAKARTGVQVGLATPYLYDLAGSTAVRDVVPASAGTWYRRDKSTGQLWLETLYLWDTHPQSLQSAPGWDPVTGLGIPRGSDFLDRFGAEQ